MSRVRALVVASHPGPCLAITALATLLAAQAAPHGVGPVLTAPAMLAGQLSVGWSNDALDSERDAAAGRGDKPVAAGRISQRAVWIAAFTSLVAALAMSLAIGPATLAVNALIIAAAWAYNLGLKATLASGLMYILGFGPIPAFATSTLPGHPLPRWWVTAAAAAVGLGAHFANVLPDLAGDQRRRSPRAAATGRGPLGRRGRPRGRDHAAARRVRGAPHRGIPGTPLGRGRRAVRLLRARGRQRARHGPGAVPRRDRHRRRRRGAVRRRGGGAHMTPRPSPDTP